MSITSKNSKQLTDPLFGAQKLEDYFRRQKNAIIAYSGGVDSALLAFAAHRALNRGMVAMLADSPSLSRREYRCAVDFAQNHGIPLQIIRTREMQNRNYQANQADRCYHCKKALFEKIEEHRHQLHDSQNIGSWPIFYGVNMDDLGDYRPGILAAREASIQAPYVDLGLDKQGIRTICAHFNIEVADKPAMPCMASRIAYGEEVSLEKLNQVEKAEDVLYDLGFRVLRVRHHGDIARIEIPAKEFEKLLRFRKTISQKFHELGFTYISLDLDGFKSGSLNAVLEDKQT